MLSGGGPTSAGTSEFTNWDMGMGHLWLNGGGGGGGIYDLMVGHYGLMGWAFMA